MKKILILLLVIILIALNVDAQTITEWLNTEEGKNYAVTGITTYYVGDIVNSSSLNLMYNTAMPTGNASEINPAFTITSQIKLNDVNVGENSLRIKENGNLKCFFNIKNNTDEERKITVVIATYTERKSLCRLSPVSLTLEASVERNFELDYTFNADYEDSGKIMFWDSLAGMVPLRTSIDFNQTNGVNAYYYNLDNRLLQIDKSNGTSFLYTYDKMGNLLTKTVRK